MTSIKQVIDAYISQIQRIYLKDDIIPIPINELCILYFNDRSCFINIFCRIRPLSDINHETKSSLISQDGMVEIERPGTGIKAIFDSFDKVYGSEVNNEQIATDLRDRIDNLFQGSTCTICAYGSSPSGKTHTIIGSKDDYGIAQRSIQYLFHTIATGPAESYRGRYTIKCAMFEIYNEKLRDLTEDTLWYFSPYLNESNGAIDDVIKEQPLTWHTLNFVDDYTKLHDLCCMNRHKRPSSVNNSYVSRSHVFIVFRIYDEKKMTDHDDKYFGELCLVDLCGSQRTKKVGVSGQVLRENVNVGRSLGAFINVLYTIQSNKAFIPIKDSTLTMLLKRNFSNGNDVIIYLNVYPEQTQDFETISTLRFGSRIQNSFKR